MSSEASTEIAITLDEIAPEPRGSGEIELAKDKDMLAFARMSPPKRRYVVHRSEGDKPIEAFCKAFRRTLVDKKADPDKWWRLWNEAMLIERNKHVQQVLKLMSRQVEEMLLENYRCTLGTHLRDLEVIRDKAVESEAFSPAVRAEELRGKAVGLHVEQVESTVKHVKFADAIAQIEGDYKVIGDEDDE